MIRSGINFQTLPKELRRLFIADPGWQFIQFDMSQIEARILSCLLKKPKLYEFFLSGQDIHSLVAGEIFGCDPSSLTKASPQRGQAKSCVHGANYGLQAPHFSRMVGTSVRRAQEILESYYETFGIIDWWLDIVRELKENKKTLTTPYGRRGQFLGDFHENKQDFKWLQNSEVLKKAYSFKPQSTNADFTKERLVFILNKVDKEKFIPVINLHDEWVILCKDSYIKEVSPIIIEEVARPLIINGREISVPCSLQILPRWK